MSFEQIRDLLLSNYINFTFLALAIQWTFVTNGIQLLDVPHHLYKFLMYVLHKREMKKEDVPRPFRDDYPFDLGYYQSFAIVVFCTGLVFSGVIPLVSLFVTTFFFIRYYIDKYNLIFVYNREFEGGGIIVKKQVIPLVVFSLYMFQLLNLFYFGIINPYYFKGGLIFLSVETLALLIFKMYLGNKKR